LSRVQTYSAVPSQEERKKFYRKSLQQVHEQITKDNLTLFPYQYHQLIYMNKKIDLITLEYFFEKTPNSL